MEEGKCKKNIHASSNPRRWWMYMDILFISVEIRAHIFGSWHWIGQLLGGIAQCLFINQVRCAH
jgi:hypothetical protein